METDKQSRVGHLARSSAASLRARGNPLGSEGDELLLCHPLERFLFALLCCPLLFATSSQQTRVPFHTLPSGEPLFF